MKYFPSFLLLFFSIIFTGCFDILEDISINADGSGKYSITFDMDGIISDPFMKEMVLESIKKDANLAIGENEKIVIDSTVFMKDDPQFDKFKDNKALWETAKMHMVVNEETGKMFANFGFDFDEVGDIVSPAQGNRSQLQTGNPPLGAGFQHFYLFGGKG